MKFSSYNPVVNPNTLQNVQVRGAMAPQRFQPLMGESAQWKSFADMAKMGLSLHKDVVDGKTMEANAEYNRLMSEGTSALMQRKEGEALNIVDDYDKLQKDVLGQVRKKYGNYIGYGTGAEAFNAFTMRDNATRREHMVKYQTAQTEKFQETQFNNQLATCQEFVIGGGGSDQAINEAFNRGIGLLQSRYANYGQEKIKEQERIFKGQLVESALSLAVGAADYARMEEIAAKYPDVLDPKTLSSVIGMVSKRKKEAKSLSKHQLMMAELGPNPTDEQVVQWVERNHEKKYVRHTGNVSEDEAYRSMRSAIMGQESGGNSEAENERTGAYGLFQIMPENWPYWAQAAGLGADAAQTAENQEIVFEHKIREYIREYGAEGAAVAWYAGPANGARWRDGEPDAIGEGGHFSWDAPQGNGDEPSVREYVEQVFGRMGDAPDIGEFDAVSLEEEKQKALEYAHKQKSIVKATQNQKIEDYSLAVLDAALHGGDLSAIQAQLVNEDDRVRLLVEQKILGVERANERSVSRRARGEAEPNDAEVTGFFDQKIVYALDHGMMNVDQAREYIFQNPDIPNSKKEKLLKMLDRYVNGEKEFAYEWDDIESDVASLLGLKKSEMGSLWALIKKATLADIREYMHEHDGEAPTQQWVIDTCVQNGMTIEVRNKGNGWFDSDEVETTSAAALRDKGVEIQSDNGDGTYNVSLLDSQGNPVGTFRISAKDMVEIARSNLPAKDVLGFERNRINIEE